MKLQLARKIPKRRRPAAIKPLPKATRPNEIWTYDFVFDQVVSGRKLKMLNLVDEFTRECLAIEIASSITSAKVGQVLEGSAVNAAYSLVTSGSQIGTTVTVTDQAGKLRRSITNALGQLIRVDESNSSN